MIAGPATTAGGVRASSACVVAERPIADAANAVSRGDPGPGSGAAEAEGPNRCRQPTVEAVGIPSLIEPALLMSLWSGLRDV